MRRTITDLIRFLVQRQRQSKCRWRSLVRAPDSDARERRTECLENGRSLECVSKIPEYAISGVAAPFLRHKARLSAAKPSGFFLELTQNPLELADFPF